MVYVCTYQPLLNLDLTTDVLTDDCSTITGIETIVIRNEKRHNYAVTRPTGASNCMWEHGSQYVEDTFVFQDVHNHCELSATFKQEHSSSPSQNKFATDGEHSSTTYRIMLTAVFVESTAANGTR